MKDLYGCDNKIHHKVFDKVEISIPQDKVCNFNRSAGMILCESFGNTTTLISRMSKHEMKDKINVAYMNQSPEQTMHTASGHFLQPKYES